jgi:hypothetical protein
MQVISNPILMLNSLMRKWGKTSLDNKYMILLHWKNCSSKTIQDFAQNEQLDDANFIQVTVEECRGVMTNLFRLVIV